MNHSQHPGISPREVLHLLRVHARRWWIPTLVVTVLAAGYALVRSPTWNASQAMIVRNEASNNQEGLGKFSHPDEMKTVQETILELAKSRGVLTASLEEIGPPANYRKDKSAWPSARDVADLRTRIELAPPNGAEFGTTEVFYLETRDHDRKRAIALNEAICGQLLTRFQDLRDVRAQSMMDELAKAVQLTKEDLHRSTLQLSKLEQEVGGDLTELRLLAESASGDSPLQQTITEIRNELRQTQTTRTGTEQLLAVLRHAQENSGRLIAAPSRLLESQPALSRLKDGLIDAEIRTAQLRGNMSDIHPLVIAARQAEEEIGRHLHKELAIALRGLEVEQQYNSDRLNMLNDRLQTATGRLERLAGMRAEYLNRVIENRSYASLVERAANNLAEARASHAGAKASSLIDRIDLPDTGVKPIGPSHATIVLIGIVGGLLIGFGFVFLTVNPSSGDSQEVAQAVGRPQRVPTSPAHPEFRPESRPEYTDMPEVATMSLRRALAKAAARNGTAAAKL